MRIYACRFGTKNAFLTSKFYELIFPANVDFEFKVKSFRSMPILKLFFLALMCFAVIIPKKNYSSSSSQPRHI